MRVGVRVGEGIGGRGGMGLVRRSRLGAMRFGERMRSGGLGRAKDGPYITFHTIVHTCTGSTNTAHVLPLTMTFLADSRSL